MMLGVRYGEVVLPPIGQVKDGTLVRLRERFLPVRPVVGVSMGPHLSDRAMFHIDPGDRDTMMAGAFKRFAARQEEIDPVVAREFATHVKKMCRKHFVPLSPFTDFSVEKWLSSTNYPLWRKEQLLEEYNKHIEILRDPKQWKVKSFPKDEMYIAPKHARGINSRTDAFKTIAGPMFKAIEKVIFQNEVFIKKIPVRDRAKQIMEALWAPGAWYVATDYTTYEASFTRTLMIIGEFQVYLYFIKHTPQFRDMLFMLWIVIGGENICTFRDFIIVVFATRMSGEMCTSVGNGVVNWMLFDFACSKSLVEYVGRFEGDDGIARISGEIDVTVFGKLGLKIKLEKHPDLSEASFCGLIFDEIDMEIVTDPIKVLMSFGWANAKYRNSKGVVLRQLLRAKALSTMCGYPACPIVTELARYALRMTHDKKIRQSIVDQMDVYKRDEYLYAVRLLQSGELDTSRPIGPGTRMLVERKFGISIEQQIKTEEYFAAKHDFAPFSLPWLNFPDSLLSMDSYVLDCPVGDDNFIGEWWQKVKGFEVEWTLG